ncbi:MAG: hypothetical protein ACOYJO_03175 [Eubacterium sp.]|jgi:hypothetical protein
MADEKDKYGAAEEMVNDGLESAEIQGRINSEMRAIMDATSQIGMRVMQLYSEGSVDLPEDMKALIDEISKHEAALRKAQKDLDEVDK